jgi:putative endonuclease
MAILLGGLAGAVCAGTVTDVMIAAMRNFVYVIGARDRGGARTYVGWTNDVARRLQQHNSGRGARSTRGRCWVLLHLEAFPTRNEAMSREQRLKRDRPLRAAIRACIPVV